MGKKSFAAAFLLVSIITFFVIGWFSYRNHRIVYVRVDERKENPGFRNASYVVTRLFVLSGTQTPSQFKTNASAASFCDLGGYPRSNLFEDDLYELQTGHSYLIEFNNNLSFSSGCDATVREIATSTELAKYAIIHYMDLIRIGYFLVALVLFIPLNMLFKVISFSPPFSIIFIPLIFILRLTPLLLPLAITLIIRLALKKSKGYP